MTKGRRELREEGDDEWDNDAEHSTGGYSDGDDFDYEEYLQREFPANAVRSQAGGWKTWTWRVVVVAVCLVLIWRFLLY